MNHSILRGFCQHLNCNLPVQFVLEEMKWVHRDQTYKYFDHEADGIGFLSAKQIEIVSNHHDFVLSYCGWSGLAINDIGSLIKFVKREPFLVARILKESEKK